MTFCTKYISIANVINYCEMKLKHNHCFSVLKLIVFFFCSKINRKGAEKMCGDISIQKVKLEYIILVSLLDNLTATVLKQFSHAIPSNTIQILLSIFCCNCCTLEIKC